ncbi:MAG: DUF4956 domain-containing protein [Oscillospiraceae bacterium]|jgi:uncharacterized membrane protein YhiD involved in acid resistance|nr:DUF4956 domain-containing protein [Oscillospiraceae bacterium]
MTFSDIFKSSFLEKATEASILDIVIAMALAFAVGLFIFFVYKKTFAGVMYSASFGVSIMAMTLITTLIILAVTSNVVLSLGMVGALSIVRFRTAVKEPLDIAFLFWSISAGIVIGAGLLPLAVIGSVIIGLVLFLFVSRKNTHTPYIIVLSLDSDAAEIAAIAALRSKTQKMLIKSKTVSKNGIELTAEVRITDMSARLVNELLEIEGVRNASLVSYNGEYTA